MSDSFEMQVIARIRSDFGSKFGVPRQSGLVDALEAAVVFEPPYRNPDALRGLEGFSHIWLIWAFHQAQRADWSPTVRPPRLGGNQRVGVFASRSPFRPNPIGLSSVRLDRIAHTDALGPVLHVRGADLVDGTPILDIKPYLPYGDCHPEATGGFASEPARPTLEVEIPPPCWSGCPRTGGRPCGMCWPWTPVPGISRTRSGYTASSSPDGRSDSPWMETACGSWTSNERRAPREMSRGACLFRMLSAWPASRRRSPPARRGCRPRRSRWRWPSPPARKPSWRGSRWYLPAGSSSETARY